MLAGCCHGTAPDPVEAALDDGQQDLGCPMSQLQAVVTGEDTSCDEDGNCTDDTYVAVSGCNQTASYDCSPCLSDYTCSRSF